MRQGKKKQMAYTWKEILKEFENDVKNMLLFIKKKQILQHLHGLKIWYPVVEFSVRPSHSWHTLNLGSQGYKIASKCEITLASLEWGFGNSRGADVNQ